MLWSEKTVGMISVFLNLLRLVLWLNKWSILEKNKIIKNHKQVEGKQYATKLTMDHWRNQGGNKKITEDKY